MIRIERAGEENFREDSLDGFDRFLATENEYRLVDGELKLVKAPSAESWTPERRREKAREILAGTHITYCAFDGGRVVGEIMLLPALENGRLVIDSFQVSREYRRRGVGRALLAKAAETARDKKARALYASARAAEATIGFYLAMGFCPSEDPIASYVRENPGDIPMECALEEV